MPENRCCQILINIQNSKIKKKQKENEYTTVSLLKNFNSSARKGQNDEKYYKRI